MIEAADATTTRRDALDGDDTSTLKKYIDVTQHFRSEVVDNIERNLRDERYLMEHNISELQRARG